MSRGWCSIFMTSTSRLNSSFWLGLDLINFAQNLVAVLSSTHFFTMPNRPLRIEDKEIGNQWGFRDLVRHWLLDWLYTVCCCCCGWLRQRSNRKIIFDRCNLGPFTTSENQRATNATGNNLYINTDRIEQKRDRTEKHHFFRTFDCDSQIRLNLNLKAIKTVLSLGARLLSS